jgi:hypothetical protein
MARMPRRPLFWGSPISTCTDMSERRGDSPIAWWLCNSGACHWAGTQHSSHAFHSAAHCLSPHYCARAAEPTSRASFMHRLTRLDARQRERPKPPSLSSHAGHGMARHCIALHSIPLHRTHAPHKRPRDALGVAPAGIGQTHAKLELSAMRCRIPAPLRSLHPPAKDRMSSRMQIAAGRTQGRETALEP